MADETWSWRDYPILDAAVKAETQGLDLPAAISDATTPQLSDQDRERGIAALVEDGYLVGLDVTAMGDSFRQYIVRSVTGKARRATRQWPSGRAYDDLIDQIEQRIAATSDEAKKTKLRAFLDGVRAVGQDVATDVLAKVIEHQTGM